MRNQYDEVMEKLTVTEDMRRRALVRVRTADLRVVHRSIPLASLRRFAVLAACLAVLLIGTALGPRLVWRHAEDPPVQVANERKECASADALSKELDFSMSDVTTLPFPVAAATYVSYWGEMGEINYAGTDGQSAVYRKSVGTADNSGDYSSYAETTKITVGTLTAVLKGSGARYTLACWTNGACSYSLRLSPGADTAVWRAIILGIS